MRKKTKESQTEIDQIQEKLKTLDIHKRECIKIKNEREVETRVLKEYKLEIAYDLEEAKTNRQLHFERLLIQQKKISMYNDLVLGRKPFTVFKKEDQLVNEYRKQKTLNEDLNNIVEILIVKFPDYFHEFQRLINSLKMGYLVMYSYQ